MDPITVFADVSCPFAHVGLTRIAARRETLGPSAPMLRVRAWPLEQINGSPLTGAALAPKVDALREQVAPDLFGGFGRDHFPTTTLPALSVEAAAYEVGDEIGLRCSLALRQALFEEGADIGDPAVVRDIASSLGLAADERDYLPKIELDLAEGKAKGVKGSPHFFTANGDFFCPTLDIRHDDDGYHIEFDQVGFEGFMAAAFG